MTSVKDPTTTLALKVAEPHNPFAMIPHAHAPRKADIAAPAVGKGAHGDSCRGQALHGLVGVS